MSARGSLITSVVAMTTRALTRKARRGRSGATRLNANDTLRLIIIVLYLMLMILDWQRSAW
jgi:energy-coupling factor transporter transmembrane protein EcfT